MNGADWFVRVLQNRGVEWIATLCGHGLDPLYDACHRAGLRLIDTRNEQAASYLADATARLTRRPGVVAVSSGIGHVNALAGVVNAHFDGAPLLLVSGAAAVSTMGRGHFQDLDHIALAAPVCKFARVIDHPESIGPVLSEALEIATERTPGPVHLTFPMDIQRAEIGDKPPLVVRTPRSRGPVTTPVVPEAEQPLLVAGSGVFYADQGEALARFCARAAVPVVVPIWDRGSIAKPIPEFMGVIGAASGGPRLLAEADLVLLCGAKNDYRLGYLEPPAVRPDCRIVRLDPEHLETLQMSPRPGWLAEAQRRRDEFRRAFESAVVRPAGGLHALDIVDALRQVLTGETSLLIDGGSIGQWLHQLLTDRYPGHWLTCGASGVIGWGIPGAMAARLCFPNRPVILVSGDGSMTFTPAELECAVRQKLPFVAVVADDQAWGITRTGHLRQFDHAISSDLGPIDFALLAESLGARGVRVSSTAQLAAEIHSGLAESRPTVIQVPIRGGNELPQIAG
jgi:acetolactate synthase-1/2/3 large subunit